jgi:hypothetical protein
MLGEGTIAGVGHRVDSSRKIDEPERRVSLQVFGAGERFMNE